MHWAAKYIGKPWRLGARGPSEFDCWGLVRHVQLRHYGREVPELDVYGPSQQRASQLHEIVRRSPWCRVDFEIGPLDGDVLLMKSADGPHVGIALNIGGVVGCLHALGSVSKPQSVVFTDRIDELSAQGFARIQIWRFQE